MKLLYIVNNIYLKFNKFVGYDYQMLNRINIEDFMVKIKNIFII